MPDDLSSPWQNPETVSKFLRDVRGTVPLAIEQIDVVLRLVTATRERIDSFLNLGCESGLLASTILDEQEHARAVVLDLSDRALEPARLQLRGVADRVEFRIGDCFRQDWMRAFERLAPFDAVLSIGGLHHLPDPRKLEVYRELFGLLKPGGLLLNIEQVSSATRWTESPVDDFMIDAIFSDRLRESGGKSRAEIAREHYAHFAAESARLAPLEVQCDWLREIGFVSVDVYLKVQELAVFGGQRPE